MIPPSRGFMGNFVLKPVQERRHPVLQLCGLAVIPAGGSRIGGAGRPEYVHAHSRWAVGGGVPCSSGRAADGGGGRSATSVYSRGARRGSSCWCWMGKGDGAARKMLRRVCSTAAMIGLETKKAPSGTTRRSRGPPHRRPTSARDLTTRRTSRRALDAKRTHLAVRVLEALVLGGSGVGRRGRAHRTGLRSLRRVRPGRV